MKGVAEHEMMYLPQVNKFIDLDFFYRTRLTRLKWFWYKYYSLVQIRDFMKQPLLKKKEIDGEMVLGSCWRYILVTPMCNIQWFICSVPPPSPRTPYVSPRTWTAPIPSTVLCHVSTRKWGRNDVFFHHRWSDNDRCRHHVRDAAVWHSASTISTSATRSAAISG